MQVGDIERAMDSKVSLAGTISKKWVERLIRWEFPREGWVRLNTDGAAKGNPGKAGAGGLIRGYRGELHVAFAVKCGDCSCTKAELKGVLHGLAFAWNGGHRKVQLTVDSEGGSYVGGGRPINISLYSHHS